MSWVRFDGTEINDCPTINQEITFTGIQALLGTTGTSFYEFNSNYLDGALPFNFTDFARTTNFYVEFATTIPTIDEQTMKGEVSYSNATFPYSINYLNSSFFFATPPKISGSTAQFGFTMGIEYNDNSELPAATYDLEIQKNDGAGWETIETIIGYTGADGDPFISSKYSHYKLILHES